MPQTKLDGDSLELAMEPGPMPKLAFARLLNSFKVGDQESVFSRTRQPANKRETTHFALNHGEHAHVFRIGNDQKLATLNSF